MAKTKWLWCLGLAMMVLVSISWAGPIQTAINNAQCGDTIQVSQGINYETFVVNKKLTIRGDVNHPENYVIDGYYNSSYHGTIIEVTANDPNCTAEIVLEGITVKNGLCVDTSEAAGIQCDVATTIRHCIIEECVGGGGGGGIGGESLTIENCIVRNNGSESGYYNDEGAGISGSDLAVKNCQIYNNYSDGWAGGLWIAGNFSTIENCSIYDNYSRAEGAGVFSAAGSGQTNILKNCMIYENKSGDGYVSYGKGAGIYSQGNLSLLNCTVVNNATIDGNEDPTNHGNGLYASQNSNTTLANCIFWDNDSMPNHPNEDPNAIYIANSSTITVNYSNIEEGQNGINTGLYCTVTWGTGNINQDPNFLDPINSIYRLTPDSVCIDTGDPNYTPATGETDIDGQDRVINDRIDMGADEIAGCTGCMFDYDHDDWVTLDDFNAFLAALVATEPNYYFPTTPGWECMDFDQDGWCSTYDLDVLNEYLAAHAPNYSYKCGGCTTCKGDYNADGWVNDDDMAILLAALVATAPDYYFPVTPGWECMDMDDDNWITIDDLNILNSYLAAHASNSYICGGCTTCKGDYNVDGWVADDDLAVLQAALVATAPNYYFPVTPGWECMDIDEDGWITLDDLYALTALLSQHAPEYYYACE